MTASTDEPDSLPPDLRPAAWVLRRLGISRSRFDHWRARGWLPVWRVGRSLFVAESDVEALFQREGPSQASRRAEESAVVEHPATHEPPPPVFVKETGLASRPVEPTRPVVLLPGSLRRVATDHLREF